MKLVFVSSPLRGDVVNNIVRAKSACRWVSKKGCVAFAPHLLFTQFLDDNNEEERSLGIQSGLELLERCDEMWCFTGEDCKMSEGMLAEYNKANELGKPIKLMKFSDITEEGI